jgi:hypothetical protein
MMIRKNTRDGGSMQKHGEIACTRRTETISMQNKEENVVAVVSDAGENKKVECSSWEEQKTNSAFKRNGA